MKTTFILLIIFVTSLIGCSQDKDEQPILVIDDNSIIENSRHMDQNKLQEHCFEVDLLAGQFHDAGNITVDIENGFLIVSYDAQGDWEIDATHLYVGDCEAIPVNKKGNPKIGHFPYSGSHPDGTTLVVYSIDLNDLSDCLCIAAHAEVSIDIPGTPYQGETAWGNGSSFGGGSWAMYFDFCLAQCQPTTPY